MLESDAIVFLLLSFEGPDVYAQAGGLGVRVKELSRALAERGHETHVFFVGDPELAGEESLLDGRLVLHRWAQWVSRYHPLGVYQGEEGKRAEVERSLPDAVVDGCIAPAVQRGRRVVVLGEEWQMARTMALLGERLSLAGIRDRCLLLWNANNHFGFERIDWPVLTRHVTLTTVSRYMKHIMWRWGVNPIVIPNGIPASLIATVSPAQVRAIRAAAGPSTLLFKIGRFSPDKRWLQAVAAVAHLNAHGVPTRLLMRGGIEPYGMEVLALASQLGLRVAPLPALLDDVPALARALREQPEADVWNVTAFLPDALLPPIYAAATATLANSGHEPFGLVGLEAMACGGVAFVGATGEDYAEPFRNAMVIETEDAAEIATYVRFLTLHPETTRNLRIAAQRTAREFTWQRVIDLMLRRLEFVASRQGWEG